MYKKQFPDKRNLGKKFPQNSRENHYNWKGGITTNGQGYIYILQPNHPFANKRGHILRSHLVIEKMIGRHLRPGEIVHHKGERYPIDSIKNKQDDRPENLQLFANKSEHNSFHKKLRLANKFLQ
jgi:hypothetical protein